MKLEHKTAATGDGESPTGGTVDPLAELRATWDAIDDSLNGTEIFDIPGSTFAVRYRRLGYEESVQIFENGEGAQWELNAQFLIVACDEILRRDADGNLQPLVPGERVTFDLRPGESIPLHQALGRETTSVRDSVLRVFQGSDRALLAHANRVDAWMDTLTDRARETFAGGS